MREENVLKERYLRDAEGKIVKDEATGKGRCIDFVIKGKDAEGRVIGKPREITSRIASKVEQLAKERRIIDAGGKYVRDPKTRELIPVDGLSTAVRVR